MAKLIAGLLALCVSMPIWFYLLYQLLVRVEASELMWFLFWVYMPVTLGVSVVVRMVERE